MWKSDNKIYFGESEYKNPKLSGNVIDSNLSFFCSPTDYKV